MLACQCLRQLETFKSSEEECVSISHEKNREDERTRLQQRQSGQEEAARQGLSTQEDQAQVKAIRVETTNTGTETQEVKQPQTK